MKIEKTQELIISTQNRIGLLADVSAVIAQTGVNIRAIAAYTMENQAVFEIVSSDNAKTEQALKDAGYTIETKEVILIELPDKAGQLSALAAKIKDAGIDLKYIYGTTDAPQENAILVIGSDNNDKILEILSVS